MNRPSKHGVRSKLRIAGSLREHRGARRLAARASRRYIAGPRLQDALSAEAALRARGWATVIGFWDGSDDTPDGVRAQCLRAVDALSGRGDAQLSIKPPALAGDPGRLPERAAQAGVALHVDSLAPDTADACLELGAAFGAGITLPGRWTRSPGDAARLGGRVPVVRVVKGQWADPADPRRDASAGFLDVVDALAGSAQAVAVATHDGALAATALRRLLAAGTRCELQLLFGLPAAASLAAARDVGVPVRAYVPYGRAYLPYALSALRRRPRLALVLARDLARGDAAWAVR